MTRDDAYLRLDFDISAASDSVGTSHSCRAAAKMVPTDAIIENSSNRRRGIGAGITGAWKGRHRRRGERLAPVDYFTVSTLLSIPGAPKIIMTHAVQDRLNGER